MKFKLPFKIINLENKQIEKRLVLLSIICFVLLITVQVVMTNPSARNILTQEEEVEGVFLQKSGQIADQETIVIELVDLKSMGNLWVMVNGKRIARFSGKRVTLSVSDGELIEIDSTDTNTPAKVRIAEFSKNVILSMSKDVLETKKNIAVLARIRIARGVY